MLALLFMVFQMQSEVVPGVRGQELYCVPDKMFDTVLEGCQNDLGIRLFMERLIHHEGVYCVTERDLNRLLDLCFDLQRV